MKRCFLLCLLLLTFVAVPADAYIKDVDINYHCSARAADRAKFEEVIKNFACAIYETSDGEIQIGDVRISLGGSDYQYDYWNTDIIWGLEGVPFSVLGPGLPEDTAKRVGRYVRMFDVIDGINVLDEPRYGGYILADLVYAYMKNDKRPSKISGRRIPEALSELKVRWYVGATLRRVYLSTEDKTIPARGLHTFQLYVEPGIPEILLFGVTDGIRAGKFLNVTVLSPDGRRIEVPYRPEFDNFKMTIDNVQPGRWSVMVSNRSRKGIYTRIIPFISASTSLRPHIETFNTGAGLTVYTSITMNGVPVTGLNVTGTLTGKEFAKDISFKHISGGVYSCHVEGLKEGNYRAVARFEARNPRLDTKALYMPVPGSVIPDMQIPFFKRVAVTVGQVRKY